MDNFEFKFVSDNEGLFDQAMMLAMGSFKSVVAWSLDPEGNLIFHWSKPTYPNNARVQSLPFEMDCYAAGAFALEWWKQNKPKDSEPNIDGSTGRAYEISSVYAPWRYQFVKIRCVWALYGK